MIIVTGGSGLIGSNLIRNLNLEGLDEIIVVDDLTNGKKMHNLADLKIIDYLDKEEFLSQIEKKTFPYNPTVLFHLGACSATTVWDGKYLMKNNYEYSKKLLIWALEIKAQFIYASSASVYGLGKKGFVEDSKCENPINMYAYSKYLFDNYVRQQNYLDSQVVGLRYFNVYGPCEQHKGSMASTVFHFNNQILEKGSCNLFKGIKGYKNGEQKRDFIHVDDCASVNLWFMKNKNVSGIFNVGTGNSYTFNALAESVLKWHKLKRNFDAKINYIEFPEHLKGSYQSFTQANIDKLRSIGYNKKFLNIHDGVFKYLDKIAN